MNRLILCCILCSACEPQTINNLPYTDMYYGEGTRIVETHSGGKSQLRGANVCIFITDSGKMYWYVLSDCGVSGD